ncbi:MAG: hypothetical protein WD757_09995 [Actinomycetota bacterium]
MALSPGDKRALIILGGVVGVAALAWLFFLRGGGAEESTPVAAPERGGTETVTTGPATPTPTFTPTLPPPPSLAIPVIPNRDPFSPVIGSPSPGAETSPSPTTSDGDGGGGGGGGGSQTDTKQDHGNTVTLLNVKNPQGQLQVNVKVNAERFQNLEVGDPFFDGAYKVSQITDPCATFQYQSAPKKKATGDKFTLCAD